jgi:hypothetical protein
MSSETVPQVFVIESLDRDDEARHREGRLLYNVLRMMRRDPKYTYIRTAKELEHIALEFAASRYRYLHLSCHGNNEGFALTYDDVPFERFAAAFGGILHERRVFLSACSVAQPQLATKLFQNYETAPYSATGPSEAIDFSTSTVIWANLYDLLFRDDCQTVLGEQIRKHLEAICRVNSVNFSYFGRRTKKPYFTHYQFPRRRRR